MTGWKLPDEQCLCKTSLEVCFFVNFQADEQLEALNLLSSEQLAKQGNAQTSDAEQVSSVTQKSPHAQNNAHSSEIEIRPDLERERRKGTPEVIFGETKTVAQIIAMAQALLDRTGRAIISRVRPEVVEMLREAFPTYNVNVREAARCVVIYRPDYVRRRTGGLVGVISAGTSDIPVADEAAVLAEEMGCEVTRIYDVGVAGLHRLVDPLRNLLSAGVDVIVVAAGMDGALPSVVAGLVPVPVIGLPTAIGYGLGGKGVAALLSMLQTCAPGLSVVNIDNGVGAGITAALIANRVAQAREHHLQ